MMIRRWCVMEWLGRVSGSYTKAEGLSVSKSLLHLRRWLALSAGTKIDKLRTVLGKTWYECYGNLCMHTVSIKRHIVCILFLPLSGTGLFPRNEHY